MLIRIPEMELRDLRLRKDGRSGWHGKECILLGTWDANKQRYSAIKFPWNDRYSYELCPPHWVTE